MSELLAPNLKDIEKDFNSQFHGMTNIPITLSDLLDTREQLIRLINEELSEQECQFLLSIKSNTPDWSLIELPNIEHLPAIQWKLKNISMMDKEKHLQAINKLKKVLGL